MSDIQALIELLKSDDPNKRYDACEELKVRRHPLPQEAMDALHTAAHDPNPEVADAAQRALAIHAPQQKIDVAVEKEMGKLETNNRNVIPLKKFLLWSMVFGALATLPWMVRLGIDIGEFWNLLATAIIGALLSGILGFLGWNIFRNVRGMMITCGISAIVIIFVLSFLMKLMPV